MAEKLIKVLLVGQTPPPYGGQAIAIESIVKAKLRNIKIYCIRMHFSKELDDCGKINVRKIGHLFHIMMKIVYMHFKYNIDILYYPPAGPNKIPIMRDAPILFLARFLFKTIIFHYHAAGIAQYYLSMSGLSKLLLESIYLKPDMTIHMTASTIEDGLIFKSRKIAIIPYGITDVFESYKKSEPAPSTIPTILFVGILKESKGFWILLQACRILKNRGISFKVNFVGQFESEKSRNRAFSFVDKNKMAQIVQFSGILTGDRKWDAYQNAEIFCLPSFFENEGMPLVILEAMQFRLPVISTDWRGIPTMVIDGKTGYLVPIKNIRALVNKLALLLINRKISRKMGMMGRKIYFEKYKLDIFLKNIENAFHSI